MNSSWKFPHPNKTRSSSHKTFSPKQYQKNDKHGNVSQLLSPPIDEEDRYPRHEDEYYVEPQLAKENLSFKLSELSPNQKAEILKLLATAPSNKVNFVKSGNGEIVCNYKTGNLTTSTSKKVEKKKPIRKSNLDSINELKKYIEWFLLITD